MGINIKLHDKASLINYAVMAADDGITTTFAVVAGSLGAALSPTVVIILGFANLFADGISMTTGSYLGLKSELEVEKEKVGNKPIKSALATFVSFVVFGFLPLIPYVFKIKYSFVSSAVLVFLSLMVVGLMRGVLIKKNKLRCMVENITIGGLAAFVAYIVGFLVDKYLI